MRSHSLRTRGASKSPLIQLLWYFLGIILATVGFVLLVAPLVPWVFGAIILATALTCFIRASKHALRRIIGLPGIGTPIATHLRTGISREEHRYAIRFVAFMLGLAVYKNPEAWISILGYILTILVIECIARLQRQHPR